ncbi:MAG: hypothetical protein HOV83_21875 [Catenulispora sp.]|nr:hypothetical protein [Catenulispora sp.]
MLSRRRASRTVRHRIAGVRRWLRAFRRTRPFWGGTWMMVGGWVILHYAMAPLQLLIAHGLASMGGYLFGGGLMACGLVVWLAPQQRFTFGVIGALLAIGSLLGSNLGGFFVGMLIGVVGASMTLGWGDKKPRRRRRAAVARGASR